MPGALLAALITALAASAMAVRRAVMRRRAPATVHEPSDDTHMDERGAVRSIQAAEATIPASEVERIWNPLHLERLARTYWRFLQRVTLGLIRVRYTEEERTVMFLFIPLLRFQKPEYELDAKRGMVRWRIEDGLLVARKREGYLEIEITRRGPAPDAPGYELLYLEVEVANFYPMLAFSISRWFYDVTQSRIHVLVTYGFLRSLARLDLARSKVRRFDPR